METKKIYQNKGKKSEYNKRYYQRNKEKLLANSKKYRQEHS